MSGSAFEGGGGLWRRICLFFGLGVVRDSGFAVVGSAFNNPVERNREMVGLVSSPWKDIRSRIHAVYMIRSLLLLTFCLGSVSTRLAWKSCDSAPSRVIQFRSEFLELKKRTP